MRKNNKRALVVSAISILLCLTMLVGSTFAWFTDTARTTVNTIQAGTLDIDIVDASGNSLNGKTLTFEDKDDNDLWEPNCTYKLQTVNLVNKGNLALKFKVDIKGIVGDTDLADVIDVVIGGATVGTLSDLMQDTDGAAYGYLLPGETASIGQIELHMQETAGNEYQGKAINGLAIYVSAAQYTYESDSNDDQYDANAEYAPVTADYYVDNSADLIERLKAAEVGETVAAKTGTYTIAETVETKGTLVVESGEKVTLNLNGTLKAAVSKAQNAPTIENSGNLTIVGGAVQNKNGTNGNQNVAAIKNVSGNLTLEGCTIENVAPTSGGAYALVVSGGKATLNDSTVKGNRGGIAVSGTGSIAMTGGAVSAVEYYPLYTVGDGASTFNGVTFTKLANNRARGNAIVYNTFTNGTAAFTGCTFNSELTNTKLALNNNTTGLTFTNCTNNNGIQ